LIDNNAAIAFLSDRRGTEIALATCEGDTKGVAWVWGVIQHTPDLNQSCSRKSFVNRYMSYEHSIGVNPRNFNCYIGATSFMPLWFSTSI